MESRAQSYWFLKERRDLRTQVTASKRLMGIIELNSLLMGSQKAFSRSGKSPFCFLDKKIILTFQCESLICLIPLFSWLPGWLCHTSLLNPLNPALVEQPRNYSAKAGASHHQAEQSCGSALSQPWDEQSCKPVYRVMVQSDPSKSQHLIPWILS